MGDILAGQGRLEEAASYFEKSLAKGHEKPEDVRAKLIRIRKAENPSP